MEDINKLGEERDTSQPKLTRRRVLKLMGMSAVESH